MSTGDHAPWQCRPETCGGIDYDPCDEARRGPEAEYLIKAEALREAADLIKAEEAVYGRSEKQLIREIFSTLIETADEIEGGQVPGAGWLHTRRSINQWLCDRRDWELTEGVALREEASDAE